MKYLPLILIAGALLVSCQKELSGELGEEDPVPDDEMQSCYISRISQMDIINDVSIGYLGVDFDSDFRATRVEDYDLFNSVSLKEATIQYRGDTAWVGADMYYVLNPVNRRVLKSVVVDTEEPFSGLVTTFNYSNTGYLTSQVLEYINGNNRFEVSEDIYTWLNGNLMKIVSTGGSGDNFELSFDYHSGIEVENFLYFFGFFDILGYPFELAFNFGKKPKNALKWMWFSGYDEWGDPVELETTFYDYQVGTDKQVLSFFVENNDFVQFGLYAGKNQLTYSCR